MFLLQICLTYSLNVPHKGEPNDSNIYILCPCRRFFTSRTLFCKISQLCILQNEVQDENRWYVHTHEHMSATSDPSFALYVSYLCSILQHCVGSNGYNRFVYIILLDLLVQFKSPIGIKDISISE